MAMKLTKNNLGHIRLICRFYGLPSTNADNFKLAANIVKNLQN